MVLASSLACAILLSEPKYELPLARKPWPPFREASNFPSEAQERTGGFVDCLLAGAVFVLILECSLKPLERNPAKGRAMYATLIGYLEGSEGRGRHVDEHGD